MENTTTASSTKKHLLNHFFEIMIGTFSFFAAF
jgi:hypothetical protein